VVLDSGDLATAMRASMAIPAHSPRGDEQHILSDGGMVRNIRWTWRASSAPTW